MKRCRMCENKFSPKDKDPEDGLCIMCHISLCQEGVTKCSRCTEAIEKLIAWAMNFDEECKKSFDEELSSDFDKKFKEKFKKKFGDDFKENFKERY